MKKYYRCGKKWIRCIKTLILHFLGGTAKDKYKPKSIQCYNQGSDGLDVQWRCEDDNMPLEYQFGKV